MRNNMFRGEEEEVERKRILNLEKVV